MGLIERQQERKKQQLMNEICELLPAAHLGKFDLTSLRKSTVEQLTELLKRLRSLNSKESRTAAKGKTNE